MSGVGELLSGSGCVITLNIHQIQRRNYRETIQPTQRAKQDPDQTNWLIETSVNIDQSQTGLANIGFKHAAPSDQANLVLNSIYTFG